MRGWRRRKFTGGITVIITIIAGTVGIIATITITIIIVTGTVGKCGGLAQPSSRPVHRGPVLIYEIVLKLAEIAARSSDLVISNRSTS